MTVLITADTRDEAITALLDKLDALRADTKHRPDYYSKADWRGQLHRRAMVARMVAVRHAIGDLRPPRWPSWYRTEPTVAWSREGR